MRKLILLAGAAALTLTVPLFAQGHGGQGGKGGGKHSQASGSRGGGQHGQGGARHAGGGGGKGSGSHAQAQHGQGGEGRRMKQGGGQQHAGRDLKMHAQGRGHQNAQQARSGKGMRGTKQRWAGGPYQVHGGRGHVRVLDHPGPRRYVRGVDWRRPGFNWASVHVNCPPGLLKKGNGCLPPGQARKWFAPGQRFVVAGYPWHRDVYGYYDWFGYRPFAVPVRYSSFYYDAPGYYYRQYDGYIYRVATGTDLVLGLIPLLGGGFSVGRPLPLGYNVYNVPYGYRTVYYDQPDVWYRYGDHAIYAVDPETRLVEDIVALTTGNVVVGQPLPVGYDVYNVPYAYRDRYYDTDDYLYRYSDGYIYQVEPRTRVVQTSILVV